MADHSVVNLRDVEDMAPRFGLSPAMESRFARGPRGLKESVRMTFGRRHEVQEEVYVVVSGRPG